MLSYVIRRLGVFVLVMWAAATVNFVIPRLSPADPIKEALAQSDHDGRRAGEHGRAGQELRGALQARPAGLEAVRELPDRSAAGQPRLLDRVLPGAGQRHDPDRAAVDDHPGRAGDAAHVRGRHGAGRLHGLGRARAARHPRARSTAVDDVGDSVLPARADPDLPVRVCDQDVSAGRRLQRGHDARAELGLLRRRAAARDAAGAVDRARGPGLLGAGHARHDGHRAGRGLHDARRGQGTEPEPGVHALRRAQRDPAADDGAGAVAGPRRVGRHPGRDRLFVPGRRQSAVPGHSHASTTS